METTPHHEQRRRESKEIKNRAELVKTVAEAFFYRGEKVLQAKFDGLGNMKTRYVFNIKKNPAEHEQLKAQLKKFKSSIAQNDELLKDKDYRKQIALKPGIVRV